LKKSRSSQE